MPIIGKLGLLLFAALIALPARVGSTEISAFLISPAAIISGMLFRPVLVVVAGWLCGRGRELHHDEHCRREGDCGARPRHALRVEARATQPGTGPASLRGLHGRLAHGTLRPCSASYASPACGEVGNVRMYA